MLLTVNADSVGLSQGQALQLVAAIINKGQDAIPVHIVLFDQTNVYRNVSRIATFRQRKLLKMLGNIDFAALFGFAPSPYGRGGALSAWYQVWPCSGCYERNRKYAMSPGRLSVIAIVFALMAVPAHAETIQIVMENIAIAPAEVSAKVGDTIEWSNKDVLVHTATARNGDFDVNLPPKTSVTFVVKKAGTVDYYCRYHPNMTATLKIEP